jgi:4-amino-4-deoxy-L-arabinose transferase-like glycosyltransferase
VISGRILLGAGAALGVVLGALIIFGGLDQRYLWDDEAETALLAQRVLQFGVPIAWDGASLISQECGQDYDANYVWRQTPWLPIYVTAASFKLLGPSTFAARLPFALLGLLAVPSMYLLGRRVFDDRTTAILAAASLLLSVPFLLHVRQCRYYSLVIFAAIWALYFFFTLPVHRRRAAAGLALALTVLVHSSHLLFMAVVAGLVLGLLVVSFDRTVLPWLAAALAATMVVNLPWLIGSDLGGKSENLLSTSSVAVYLRSLVWYATRIEAYAFPALLLLTALVVLAVRTRTRLNLAAVETRACLFLVVFTVAHVLVTSLVPFTFFRYALTLLPALALLQAQIVRVLAERSRAVAAGVLLLALLVDRGDLFFAGRPSVTLYKYADEIIRHVPGPIEGIVAHLRTAARPGDRVYISYGDLPLRFYTNLEVRGGQGCQSLAGWPLPEWMIVRFFFRFRPVAPGVNEDTASTIEYLKAALTPSRYRRIDLPVVDTVWENIPEPDRHVFRPPAEGAKVSLHRKIQP